MTASIFAAALVVSSLGMPVLAAEEEIMPVDLPPAPPLHPDSREAIATMSDGDLYLYIAHKGQRLMACVGSLMQREGGIVLAQRIYNAGRYPVLVDAVASTLGTQEAARSPREGSALDTANLMMSLARFGSEPGREDMRERLLRSKAVYSAASEMARVSDGECSLPPGLEEAMARVPPES